MTRAEESAAIRAMRERVFRDQSGMCWTCGEYMVLTEDRRSPRRCELAHRIGQGKVNRSLWGSRVIDHRENLRGTHPGECNRRVNINPGSIEAERLALRIQTALKRESDRRYQGRAIGRMK